MLDHKDPRASRELVEYAVPLEILVRLDPKVAPVCKVQRE